MAYEINAWLEDGAPRLQILDADTHAVRLAWRADEVQGGGLQPLFRELMLLSLVPQLQRNISQDR